MIQLLKKILIILVYRLLGPTVKIINDPESQLKKIKAGGRNLLFVLWHESTAMCFYYYRYRQAAILREDSKKGEVLAAMSRNLGYTDFKITDNTADKTAIKGIIQLIKYLKKGHDGVIAIDGPNGPYHEPKTGIFQIARKSDTIIIPVGVWYKNKYVSKKRWDRYQAPGLLLSVYY